MNSLEAIEKYIVPGDLKAILLENNESRDINIICDLFTSLSLRGIQTSPVWTGIYNSLLRGVRVSGSPYTYIRDYKPIEEWLSDGYGKRYLDEICSLVGGKGSDYDWGYSFKMGSDFKCIKTISVLSSLFVIDTLLISFDKYPGKGVFHFYRKHNRFPNDFDL